MSDDESIFSNDEFQFDEPEEIQDFEDDENHEDEVGDDQVTQDGLFKGEYENPEKQQMTLEEKKQARKDQKERTLNRRLLKPNADIIEESKKIWEQVRHKSTTKEKKRELMVTLMNIVRGKAIDVFY